MAFIYDLTDTWNAGGTTFNAIKMNVTDSASAAASRLISLQVGGAERFSVDKAGIGTFASVVRAAAGSTSAPAFSFGSDTNTGMWSPSSDAIAFSTAGSERLRVDSSGNVGIGTSAPGQTLQVVNAGNYQFRLGAGSTFNYDLGRSASDGLLYFYGNQSSFTGYVFGGVDGERMRITAAGNVGIGTSSPAERLHVSGNLLVEGASGTICDAIVDMGDQRLVLGSYFEAGVGQHSFISSTNNAETGNSPLLFRTGTTERARIDSSGNVGIGTSSPTSRLTITGGVTEIRDGNYLQLRPSGNGWDMRLQATGTQLDILSGGALGSPIMSLVNGGNVGIGTTSPTTRLQIGDIGATDATFQGRIKLEDTSGSLQSVGGLEYATSSFGAGYGWKINSIDSSGVHLVFGTRQNSTTWTETMRIDSSGNLLVGKTTTSLGTAGFVASATGMSATNANAEAANFNRQSSDGDLIQLRRGTTQVGSISVSTTATSYNTSSDYRLKDIDGPIQNSGAYIDALKPVQGSWKADGSRFIGLLAHEVQEVSETQIATGEKDGEQMQAMDYSAPEIIANLIAELQSLRARVAQLEGN